MKNYTYKTPPAQNFLLPHLKNTLSLFIDYSKNIIPILTFLILFYNQGISQNSNLEKTQDRLVNTKTELSIYSRTFNNIPAIKEDHVILLFNEAISKIQNDFDHKIINSQESILLKSQCNYAVATWYANHSSVKESLHYYNQGLSYLNNLKGTKEEAEILNGLLSSYHQYGKSDSVHFIFDQTLNHQKQTKNPLATAINGMTLGSYYITQGMTDTSITLFEKSLDILDQEHSLFWKAKCLRYLAIRSDKMGEVEKSLQYYEQSLKLQHSINDKVNEAKTLLELGAFYGLQLKPKIAFQYFDSTQKLNDTLKNLEIQAKIFHRKANLYTRLNNCEKSLEYHKKSLNLVLENEMSPWVIPLCQSNIADQYTCLGDYDKALYYINESLINGDKVGYPTFYALNLCRKGNIYRKLKRYDLASKYLQEALVIYQDIKHLINIERVSKELSEVLFELGDSKRAFEFLKVSSILKDSLSESKIEKIIVEKDKKYAIEQSQQEAKIQKSKILNLEQEKSIERAFFIAFVIIFLALLIIVYLGINNFKQRKEKDELASKSKIELYQKEMDLLRVQVSSLLIDHHDIINQPIELNTINKYLQTPLTVRELDVLTQLTMGKSNIEIGEILFVSANTVGTHLKNIYSKLEVNNRVQAVKIATNFTDRILQKQLQN
jgi:ATP/maltotriose-dependent transcriptional regulator MalT